MKNQETTSHLSLNARPELLEVIFNIADIKDIKAEIIFEVMEKVLTKLAVTKYGSRYNIKARIHRGNGAIIIERVFTVVDDIAQLYKEVTEEDEEPINLDYYISLNEAVKINPNIKLGDDLIEELPSIEFNRGMVQQSLNIINRNIKEFEKKREFEQYKDRVGDLISGTVRRSEFGNITIDLGEGSEGFIKRENLIPGERINVGDTVRALIIEVREDVKAPQIILSRTHPTFVAKLFQQEVPEIFDGVVTIKSVAREAGSRTKMIVDTNDPAIDPVGVCVGFKGSRINGVLQELKGEKIDLIKFSDKFLDLVISAFKPIEILKVIVDEEKDNLEIVVAASDLSAAIGRGGQNIKLISKLLKWNIDILNEEEEKEKRQKDTQYKIQNLMEVLDVDEVIAHLLVLEGLATLEALLEIDSSDLSKIEGFNAELATEIKERAELYANKQQKQVNKEIKELNLNKDLLDFEEIDLNLKVFLGKHGIKSLEDLADMSSFELSEILEQQPVKMSHSAIENIIMAARQKLNY